MATRKDSTGREERYTYDLAGRPIEEWHRHEQGEEALAVRHHYDEPSAENPELRNCLGRVAWVEDAAGRVFFDYDERGRRVKEVRRWSDGKEHETSVALNAADHVLARTA